jgi:predicted dehydrogenase
MNVIVHKPLANRLLEARAVIETARSNKVATHFLPASEGAGQNQAVDMIKNGAIGTLREIHNWSMRPMWPQFPTLPKDTPAVPAGFDHLPIGVQANWELTRQSVAYLETLMV